MTKHREGLFIEWETVNYSLLLVIETINELNCSYKEKIERNSYYNRLVSYADRLVGRQLDIEDKL